MRVYVVNCHANGNQHKTELVDWLAGLTRPGDPALIGPNRFRALFLSEAHNAKNPLDLARAGTVYQSGRGQGPREVAVVTRGFAADAGRNVKLTKSIEPRFAHDRWAKVVRSAPHDVKTALISTHANPARGGGRTEWTSKGLPALERVVTEERKLGYSPMVAGDLNEKLGGKAEAMFKRLGMSYVVHGVMWFAWDAKVWDQNKLTVLDPNADLGLDHETLVVDLMPVTVKKPTPAVPDAQKVIAVARKYVGFHETRSGGHWDNGNPFARAMGWADHQAWCASFACAVFKEAGLLDLIETPSPGVDQLAVGFKRARRWSEYPAIGAIPFYGRPEDLNHVGACVIAFDADTITTIEGNTNDSGSREGDGVYIKTRLRRSTNVVGYGYPRYAQDLVSADPAWQRARQTPPIATTPVPGAPKPTPAQAAWPAAFTPDIDGVDLSHWQDGAIDWARAKAAGVKFAYHKATEHTGYRDPLYVRRRREAKAAGILFGAYHFARPAKSDGRTQARFFLKTAAPTKGDARPMLDLEDKGGLSPAQLQAWVEAFVAEVKAQTGKTPVIYTNFELTRDPGCFLWVARYNDANRPPATPKAWTRPTIWQFSNGVAGRPQSVPGIGPCDINTLFPGFVHTRLAL